MHGVKNHPALPPGVQSALIEAMRAEPVSDADFNDLLWIMAQESAGIVNTRNGASTARGLFRLLRAQYGLNPRGEASFGDAKEECQGGIRYIYGRYRSAHSARSFWQYPSLVLNNASNPRPVCRLNTRCAIQFEPCGATSQV